MVSISRCVNRSSECELKRVRITIPCATSFFPHSLATSTRPRICRLSITRKELVALWERKQVSKRESYRNFGYRAKQITCGLNLPARIRRCREFHLCAELLALIGDIMLYRFDPNSSSRIIKL